MSRWHSPRPAARPSGEGLRALMANATERQVGSRFGYNLPVNRWTGQRATATRPYPTEDVAR